MIILLIALGVVALLWLITVVIGKVDKKKREEEIKQHLAEKEKEEEKESQSPFRD